ncbi:hypothetical protein C8J57DRAFT_1479115 [Mycena rebaudengoi]|nr:hypothetical protein C8J57DRAFT_1479115 [Mycena rebaudengoi]
MRPTSSTLVLLSLLALATAQLQIQCTPTDDDGTPNTGARPSTGEDSDKIMCIYQGAGACTYFPADGSFSSGSSQCPAGIAQDQSVTCSSAAPPPPPVSSQAPPPPVSSQAPPPPVSSPPVVSPPVSTPPPKQTTSSKPSSTVSGSPPPPSGAAQRLRDGAGMGGVLALAGRLARATSTRLVHVTWGARDGRVPHRTGFAATSLCARDEPNMVHAGAALLAVTILDSRRVFAEIFYIHSFALVTENIIRSSSRSRDTFALCPFPHLHGPPIV